jgi:alanine racemase
MEAQKKRCWAEISLDNIIYNYRSMRNRLSHECKFLGVIKANAYGHGAVEVARVLEAAGADYLAVAFIDEALELAKLSNQKQANDYATVLIAALIKE